VYRLCEQYLLCSITSGEERERSNEQGIRGANGEALSGSEDAVKRGSHFSQHAPYSFSYSLSQVLHSCPWILEEI